MPDTEWTSPRRMMDYYMDQSDGIGRLKTAPILTTFAHMRLIALCTFRSPELPASGAQ